MNQIIDKVKSAKIFFGLPTYNGDVSGLYLKSMLDTQRYLDKNGIHSDVAVCDGDCYVARARNQIVTAFMRSSYTHLFFIDADMGWNWQSVVRLIAHDKDFIVGAYILKSDKSRWLIDTINDENQKPVKQNGLIKCLSAATGFMCLKRNVIEKMMESYEDTAYQNPDQEKEYALFHCSVRQLSGQQKMWYGEDIDFCHKWIAIGGEIWCEPDIEIHHIGRKTWKCNLKETMINAG